MSEIMPGRFSWGILWEVTLAHALVKRLSCKKTQCNLKNKDFFPSHITAVQQLCFTPLFLVPLGFSNSTKAEKGKCGGSSPCLKDSGSWVVRTAPSLIPLMETWSLTLRIARLLGNAVLHARWPVTSLQLSSYGERGEEILSRSWHLHHNSHTRFPRRLIHSKWCSCGR